MGPTMKDVDRQRNRAQDNEDNHKTWLKREAYLNGMIRRRPRKWLGLCHSYNNKE